MNDQTTKTSAPLKVAVRIMARGEAITTIKILVNGAFVCPGADTFISNKDLVPFLDRLSPDEIQYDGSLTSYESDPISEQIESELAALRESRPDIDLLKAGDSWWAVIQSILKEQTDNDPAHEISCELAGIITAAKESWDSAKATRSDVQKINGELLDALELCEARFSGLPHFERTYEDRYNELEGWIVDELLPAVQSAIAKAEESR